MHDPWLLFITPHSAHVWIGNKILTFARGMSATACLHSIYLYIDLVYTWFVVSWTRFLCTFCSLKRRERIAARKKREKKSRRIVITSKIFAVLMNIPFFINRIEFRMRRFLLDRRLIWTLSRWVDLKVILIIHTDFPVHADSDYATFQDDFRVYAKKQSVYDDNE